MKNTFGENMSLSRTAQYIVQIALWPGRTAERLLTDPRRLRHGVCAWLVIGVIYGLVAYVGGLNGFGAVSKPWLPIQADRYYLWMGPATPLICLVNFLLLSSSIQLFAKLAKGQGSFEDTFAVVALTFFLPVFLTMWLFETPLLVFFPHWRRTQLGGLGWMPELLDSSRQALGVLWIVITLIAAVARVQRISVRRSILVTLPAFVLAWAVTMTYLR